MRYILISIYDSASGAYSRPECAAAAPAALRGFRDLVNSKEGAVSKHPDDFTLFELGSFDDNSGKFEIHEEPLRIARGKDLVGG